MADSGSFFWSTVYTDDPLTVRKDGETEPIAATPDALVNKNALREGDRVRCQLHRKRVVIYGVAGGCGPLIATYRAVDTQSLEKSERENVKDLELDSEFSTVSDEDNALVSYDPSGGEFTAELSGMYMVHANVWVLNDGDANNKAIYLHKQGDRMMRERNGSPGSNDDVQLTALISMDAGNTFSVSVYVNADDPELGYSEDGAHASFVTIEYKG